MYYQMGGNKAIEDSFDYYDPVWIFKLYVGYKYTYVGVSIDRHSFIKKK